MNRRELLKKTAFASLGVSISPTLIMSLESCAKKRPTNDSPVYLSQEHFDNIWQISELIIPKTESPGADDAKVAPFIDQLFGEFFEDDVKATYLKGLQTFLDGCKSEMGMSFLELNNEQQHDFLTIADQEESTDSFFSSMKWIILWAYFTSEPGMKSMNYLPVPGRYNGCIEIDKNEKNLVGNR